MTARCFDHRAINFVATRWILADPTFSLHLLLPPSHSQGLVGQQADEDTPQASSDEPPSPPKATEPRSGIDFLRGSAAPVTPDPPRSTVDDSAVKDTPTATPEESPWEAAFAIPPAVASCSKDPQPTAPSPTPSTVGVSVGPPSATSTPKRARSGKWAQHTLLVGGRRISASNTPADPPPAASAPPEEDVFPIRADTGSPALTKAQLREQMFLEASIIYDTRWSGQFSWLVLGKTKDGFPYVKCSVCMAYGKENTREALAVKDAATSNPDLGMVDKVVRTVAAKLGDSSVWSQRFKYLQRVIYNTNLEVQGIHTVRWLSRGDAVRRLCKVLGACIVLLWERSHKVYEIVTCYKFQFCLFFLADILADMNDLNRCFQKRDIDLTEIAKTIEATTADLTERYLDTDKQFGGEGKCWLVGFLKLHGHGGGKKVRVRGVDGEGRPVNHLYTMYERKLPGHKVGSGYEECVKLCRSFARDCVDNLNERLDDLGKLGPTKLFRAGKWPKIKAQREKKCREWLLGCSKLFRHKLPGFDLKAAERELPTFCAIMEAHHELESFTQGLTNILGSADSKRYVPVV
ncbi:unnamed protein product [Closterium sp. Naga37s-1]|nr:unnamed protein product [Closterium sp. Naga37s-1]